MLNDDLNHLIGLVYDAAIDPALWPQAIDSIRVHFGFSIAILGVFKLPSLESVVRVSCNVPEPFAHTVTQYGSEISALWGGLETIGRLPIEEPIIHSRIPSFKVYPTNRYYLEWCQPQGLIDQCVIILANDRTTNANLGLGIHESGHRPTEVELDQLRLLAPHLRRAATISRLLDADADKRATFQSAFDAMSCGAVLVNSELGIIHANPTAEEMLRRADPIRSIGGRLEPIRELVPGRLRNAVLAIATTSEVELGRRGIAIPVRRRDDEPAALHVMPLRRRSDRTGLPLEAVAAVFVADALQDRVTPTDAVATLFELTPAEARVFELVVAGRSSRQIAFELGIAGSTVRTHLLRVFDKTDRHRRADLVRLAGEIRLPV